MCNMLIAKSTYNTSMVPIRARRTTSIFCIFERFLFCFVVALYDHVQDVEAIFLHP